MNNLKEITRFLNKIEHTSNCWIWKAGKRNGYGLFHSDNKMISAHRYSYELFKEGIPNGLTIDHLCRNPSCVNPEHLEPVTFQENRSRCTSKTHCKRGHLLKEPNLIEYKQKLGIRECKQCKYILNKTYNEKKKVILSNGRPLDTLTLGESYKPTEHGRRRRPNV